MFFGGPLALDAIGLSTCPEDLDEYATKLRLEALLMTGQENVVLVIYSLPSHGLGEKKPEITKGAAG